MGGGLNDLLKAAVEARGGVRPLHVDLDPSIRVHLRMDDLRAVVQGHEWVHHKRVSFLEIRKGVEELPASCYSPVGLGLDR